MNKAIPIAGALLVVLAAIAGWWWWQPRLAPPPEVSPVAVAPGPASAPAASAAAAAPAIVHPIEEAPASAPPAAPADLPGTLVALFGRAAVLKTLQTDDFARRVVATVDNLGRVHAPSRLWPVNPTGGRFKVRRQGEVETVDPDNALRYAPFVQLVESVDLAQLAAAYVRLYPQFQAAYQELGYPKGYFNDRLVEVIDLLRATPAVPDPIAVHRPTLNSPVQPERPWVLYEFSDPSLRNLAAGQKILLRMGEVNARRIKSRLGALRALVTRAAPAR